MTHPTTSPTTNMSVDFGTQVFVKAKVDGLRRELREEVTTFRREVDDFRQETKAEFKAVKADISGLRHDVDELRRDVNELRHDVDELRRDVNELRHDVNELRHEFNDFRQETRAEFKAVKLTMGQMDVTMRQMDVRSRNGKLKNPTARIRPIPIFIPGHGAKEPDIDKFPKYADQLYNLRKPQTQRDYEMLAYLCKFYHILDEVQLETSDDSGKEGQGQEQLDPKRVVAQLEDILGLEEDKFIKFRAKAQALQQQQQHQTQAEKRDRPETSSSEGPQPHRRRLRTPLDDEPTIPFSSMPSRAAGPAAAAAAAAAAGWFQLDSPVPPPPKGHPVKVPAEGSDGNVSLPPTENSRVERLSLRQRPGTIPDSQKSKSS